MRGQAAAEGSTRISQNGYHYTKTDGRWELTHRLKVEEKLGRKLYEHERIRFKDRDRKNIDIDNLEVTTKGTANLKTQRARLIARRDELNAQIEDLDKALEERAMQTRLAELEDA